MTKITFGPTRLVFILLLLTLSACTPPPAPCSAEFLINAINNANASPTTTDTIDLDGSCIFELGAVDNTTEGNNGLPSITSPIIINGNGATIRRSLSAQKMALRLFHVSANGNLTLNNIILLDGLGMNPPDVTVPILNYGGAIYNNGQLTVNNSLITDNRAALVGGGIYNSTTGSMTITDTTIQNNQANLQSIPGERSGGIHNEGTATITGSTIVNNLATETSGGIGNSGTLTITNSTISGNVTLMLGGSAISSSGTLIIEYSTIAYNIAPETYPAIFSALDNIFIRNSIIANNASYNCSYPATSSIIDQNIDSDGSCTGFTIVGDPQISTLANNGGPTQTHAIAPSSPAKNAATGTCPATDQRGEPRPHGGACDLGAYEFTGGGPPPTDTLTPSPESASVSGWVFIDENENNVRDPAEEITGISGAILTLKEGVCPGGTTIATTESQSPDGNYSFTGLVPGTYCIVTSPLQQTLHPEYQEVTLSSGEVLGGVNFGFYPSPMPTLTYTPVPPTLTFTSVPPTLTFTPIPPRPTATFTPVPVAQVYVHIWHDTNANGTQERSEQNYQGVTVYLGHGSCDDRASGHREAVTGADGMVWFEDVPLGTYCVYTSIVPKCGGDTIATRPDEVTLTITYGAGWVVEIGYAPYIC